MRQLYWKEDIPELPDPGTPVKTEVLAKYQRRVWSLVQKPDKDTKRFQATWRFPSVRVWRKFRKYNESYEQETKGWKCLLLDCSFVSPITFEGEELSQESFKKVMSFWPGMIPSSLLHKYLATTTLAAKESLRIERECYQLWTTPNGSLKDPHPILGEVIWSMSFHEHFGVSLWSNLDEIHVKIYAVMRKALECYSQSMSINQSAIESRRRAQELTGIGPGGVIRGRR